jgi:hypothetical protein
VPSSDLGRGARRRRGWFARPETSRPPRRRPRSRGRPHATSPPGADERAEDAAALAGSIPHGLEAIGRRDPPGNPDANRAAGSLTLRPRPKVRRRGCRRASRRAEARGGRRHPGAASGGGRGPHPGMLAEPRRGAGAKIDARAALRRGDPPRESGRIMRLRRPPSRSGRGSRRGSRAPIATTRARVVLAVAPGRPSWSRPCSRPNIPPRGLDRRRAVAAAPVTAPVSGRRASRTWRATAPLAPRRPTIVTPVARPKPGRAVVCRAFTLPLARAGELIGLEPDQSGPRPRPPGQVSGLHGLGGVAGVSARCRRRGQVGGHPESMGSAARHEHAAPPAKRECGSPPRRAGRDN